MLSVAFVRTLFVEAHHRACAEIVSTRGDTEVIREELLQLLNFCLKPVDLVSTVINILTKFSVHLSRIPTHHDHLVAGRNISITAFSLKL